MTPDTCPQCGVDFQGEPIPEEYREHYGHETHYSRVIGFERVEDDFISQWMCPDCGHMWPVDRGEDLL